MRDIFLGLMMVFYGHAALAQLPADDRGGLGLEALSRIALVLTDNHYFVILENGEKQAVDDSALLGAEGFETVWYLHDQKAWEGRRNKGELAGPVTQWYESGQKKQVNNYYQGLLQSDQFYW
jgi:hypothetical protein